MTSPFQPGQNPETPLLQAREGDRFRRRRRAGRSARTRPTPRPSARSTTCPTNSSPLQQVTIVGVDLMQVERVTGRLTWPKVLGGGVITGAWLGIVHRAGARVYHGPTPWGALITGVIAGVFFGLITSAVPYAMARGTRDFSSTMQLVAGRYDVLCDPQSAETAGICWRA